MTSRAVSFWLKPQELCFQSEQELPHLADAVVIGGGITGISTAYWLSRLGLRPVVLERGELSCGATGRNGGHFVFGTNQSFKDSVEAHGLDETLALWDFTRQSAQLLQDLTNQHNIDCDLRFNQVVSLAMTPAQAQSLQESCELMMSHGLAIKYWDKKEVDQNTQCSSFSAAAVEPHHAQLWPAKLVVGLAKATQQQQAHIQAQIEVQAVTRQAEGFTITTNQGQIQAKAIVYATNALTYHLIPTLKGVIVPVRGQVIATAPTSQLFDFDWYLSNDTGYAIQRQDGRIIFGGMRWKSPTKEIGIEDDSTLEPLVGEGLKAFLRDTFISLRDVAIEYEWTGIMGFTADENPLIGELPNRPGEYISAGYTGHGMPVAIAAGKAIAEQITGSSQTLIPKPFQPERFLLG
ncbi:MAG: FAD-binding oxidoreductase [Nodosilinea sp. WJT8-NPBG4]|jgi:glycine/D-amino acid oxidase-like deaminating enzyme|nr:FAD-binding oxidoreductase [Nodosilinea sp. WJT8-NPBG4]